MRSSYSRRLAGLLVAAVMLAGCMHLDGRKVDDVRLYNAILQDDVEYVRALVEARTLALDQAIAVPGYMEGTPLLTVAARAASLGVMRYLISAGADVNARTPINETALMLASFFDGEAGERSAHSRTRHDEAVRMLLAAGAEIENYPYHYTPLSYAAYQGYDAAIRLLLSRGARVDADATGGATYINTPLMMAAIQGHTSTALQLLRGGADAGIRVHGGHTAAELAAKYRHLELARLLRCAERHGPGAFRPHACPGGMGQEWASPHATLEGTSR